MCFYSSMFLYNLSNLSNPKNPRINQLSKGHIVLDDLQQQDHR